jgi:hypothetical protein
LGQENKKELLCQFVGEPGPLFEMLKLITEQGLPYRAFKWCIHDVSIPAAAMPGR